eukprot:Amastigsp_a343743_3.p4 type:complete len:121 gc:universal Amastigsp_a343743_3:525-163(-)
MGRIGRCLARGRRARGQRPRHRRHGASCRRRRGADPPRSPSFRWASAGRSHAACGLRRAASNKGLPLPRRRQLRRVRRRGAAPRRHRRSSQRRDGCACCCGHSGRGREHRTRRCRCKGGL